jgi:hypothetical protein
MDHRITLLNRLVKAVPPEYFRSDNGGSHYYTYAWFHGVICVYVGKGAGNRFIRFFESLDYNKTTMDAHEYIARYADELEPFYVASGLTSTAAFAIEHYLIGHFKRRSEGGTLFNVAPGRLPQPPVSGETLSYGTAERAVIPPGTEPLSKQQYAFMVNTLDDHGNVIKQEAAVTYWRNFRIALKNEKAQRA